MCETLCMIFLCPFLAVFVGVAIFVAVPLIAILLIVVPLFLLFLLLIGPPFLMAILASTLLKCTALPLETQENINLHILCICLILNIGFFCRTYAKRNLNESCAIMQKDSEDLVINIQQ